MQVYRLVIAKTSNMKLVLLCFGLGGWRLDESLIIYSSIKHVSVLMAVRTNSLIVNCIALCTNKRLSKALHYFTSIMQTGAFCFRHVLFFVQATLRQEGLLSKARSLRPVPVGLSLPADDHTAELSSDVTHTIPSLTNDAQNHLILPSGDDTSHHLHPAVDAGSVKLCSPDLNEENSSQTPAGRYCHDFYV